MNAIEQGIGTDKGACGCQRRMDHSSFDLLEGGCLGKALNLHIAESMQGEPRFPDFLSFTFEHIGVNLPGTNGKLCEVIGTVAASVQQLIIFINSGGVPEMQSG